jgi:hypothetical protein
MKVFLSYAREDADRVETLYRNLAAAGFEPWMDRSDIRSGEDWLKQIRAAVADSDVFLACISKHSVNKGGVLQEELDIALRLWRKRWWRRLKVVPLRLDSTEPPAKLAHLQWFDLFTDERWRDLAPRIRRVQLRYLAAAWSAVILPALTLALIVWALLRMEQARWPPGPQRFGVTLVHHGASGPERISIDDPLPPGARVQFTIESAQDGYLYIVDQELSPTPGKPCLIFPDPRISAGANRVRSGSAITLPRWIVGGGKNYRGELLTLVMSPRPIEFTRQSGPPACPAWLAETDFTQWKTAWSKEYRRETNSGSLGRAEDPPPQGAKILTLDDPRPQTILSLPGSSPKEPALLSFTLQAATGAP